MSKTQNKTTGKAGEQIAQKYLIQKDYHILETNWKCKYGEIDIIAIVENTLAFIEVKTRTDTRYGLPIEAVDAKKRERLIKLISIYISQHHEYATYKHRVDAIGIILPRAGVLTQSNVEHLTKFQAGATKSKQEAEKKLVSIDHFENILM